MFSLFANMPKEVLAQQIQDGLVLLVLGMSTVFIFLVILIFTTKLLSKTCLRFAPVKPQVQKRTTSTQTASPAVKDAEIAAAIAAAYAKTKN